MNSIVLLHYGRGFHVSVDVYFYYSYWGMVETSHKLSSSPQ
jgi:hypothetical protein